MNTHRTTAGDVGPGPLRWLRLALCTTLVIGAGCSTYERTASEVAAAIEQRRRQADYPTAADRPVTEAGPESPAQAAGDSPATGPAHSAARGESLRAYVTDALERNPSIRAAIANVEASLEKIPQAISLPDPFLRTIIRPEPIQTAAGDMYFTLGIGQQIPMPAKLDRAGRVAAAEVRMAIEQLNATRLSVAGDVERAYYRLYVADRSIELTEAHRRSLEDLERVLAAQYRVGRTEQQDLLRTQTEVSKLRDDENRFARQRASAAGVLNQLLDYPPTRELPATKPLAPEVLDGDVEQLIALAGEHNPELAAFARQLDRDRERVKLAELSYWPDPTVGLEWTYTEPRDPFIPPINPQTGRRPRYNHQSDGGDDNWAVTLQFNLPIWRDRIEAAKREARQRLLKTEHDKRATRNMIAFRVYDAWVRVQTHQDTIALLESTLIPQARQTYEVSLTAYQAGRADFIAVIDNWRRLLDFELMLHRETACLETAFSDMQREVGLQLVRGRIAAEAEDQEKEQ